VTKSKTIMALAKLMIAAAWADGSISSQEINSLKDLLFRLPEMTARDWDELDIYIETPIGEAERERLLADLLANLRSRRDKKLALETLQSLADADGVMTVEERQVMEEITHAIQDSTPGMLGFLGKLLKHSLQQRSQALHDAPNRELYLDDFTRNKVFYAVNRRLNLEGDSINLPEEALRKLSLAGGLMARVAYVDHEVESAEFDTMVKAIQAHWKLPDIQAALVAEVAVSEVARGMDYYRLSREFFLNTTEAERLDFVDVLFAVAAGDGALTYAETEEIRTIAYVLKLTHRQFIEAKMKVPAARRGE
jgi:uncharacterized tellurite resistance protein B-like protein